MKHILYTLVAVSLLSITGCSDKESGVPPITQPIGTGTYQPLASRLFYMPRYDPTYPIGDWLAVYATEKSFEQYYYNHPDAERVDANKNSIILTSARQTRRDWDLFGQSFYKVGDNRYVLVAHVYPSKKNVWTTSALVPALPNGSIVSLLEMMHPHVCDVASSVGTYQLYNVIQYPVQGGINDRFRIIRTQKEFEDYFPGEVPTIDFNVSSLIIGSWYEGVGSPNRHSFQFARTSTDEYILIANKYFDETGTDYTYIDSFCVQVPAVPGGATVGLLSTNYWVDGSPAYAFDTEEVPIKDYTLPASFSINDDTPDSLFVIRTQEDFDRYFSAYPEAATFRLDWYSLVVARGYTTSTVDNVDRISFVNVSGDYFYDVCVTLSNNTKPDTWYTAVLVPKLDPGITPKLSVMYKNK